MDQRQVRPERTHWRDEALSLRHREYGWNVPAVDLDFPLIEYDHAEPVALIEHKNEHAHVDLGSSGIVAIGKAGDRAKLPLYVIRYADDFGWWHIMPANGVARAQMAKVAQPFVVDELTYVTFLYRLRKRTPPREVLLHVCELRRMEPPKWVTDLTA